MDRVDLDTLRDALGVYSPWTVRSVEVDELNRAINVHLGISDKKKIFGLLHSQKESKNEVEGSWQYMQVGNYRCYVHASTPATEEEHVVSASKMNEPAFLGDARRNYSHYIRQKVMLADLKSIPDSSICDLYQISSETLTQIKTDIEHASPRAKMLSLLPTEQDPIWLDILNDKKNLKTSSVPLKLLMSKLKLARAKMDRPANTAQLCIDLRQFFVSNIQSMDDELDQLCNISNEKMRRQTAVKRQQQKLVLPAVKNPVWIDLLTGRLKLNSQSVPLNLLISRQRVSFIQGSDSSERIRAIETLREYFKRNYRSLKPELIHINRAISINEKTKLRLPNPDHQIWQQILNDDTLVPSEHVAYKLLLAKLRVQVKKAHDPVIKFEAARSIRNFMHQNQNAMRKELSTIAQKLKAV